jgi:polysaccharide pyruvyl transferase WcaK-like protein
MTVTIFDTSVCTENLGDFIIMDAVRDHVNRMFPNSMVLHTATHEKIYRPTYHMVNKSDFSFVGGTNLISSNMNHYNQWKINFFDSMFLRNIVLMGVGWWQYQKEANLYTRHLLKSVLNHNIMHSVRDSYTEAMLKKAGFNNVINTSCPTMWGLNKQHCSTIPKSKAKNVVTTLTDYNKDPKKDLAFIQLLANSYETVYIWPQGSGDLNYIDSLEISRYVNILPPKLESYNSLLETDESLDFVGTRLHAGVRALQKKRRSIIIGVDNRAFE